MEIPKKRNNSKGGIRLNITLDLFIVLTTTITISLLGLVAFARNVRSRAGQSFFFTTSITTIWVICNYFADHSTANDFFTRAAFVTGMWIALSIWLFSFIFPLYRLRRSAGVLILLVAIVTTAMAASPWVVERAFSDNGDLIIHTGSLYWLYTFCLTGIMALTLVNFYFTYRVSNALHRNQIKFLTLGVGVSAFLGIMANLVLPIIVNNWSSSRFGPAALVLFASCMAYAIIKRRLFDIRLAIARTMTYLLLLGTITVFYVFIIFNIASSLFDSRVAESSFGVQLYYIFTALFIALTFGPLRLFFGKVTQRLFFQDIYETQQVIDHLTTLLVGTLDLGKITKDGMKILQQAIRPRFIELILVEDSQVIDRKNTGHRLLSEPVVQKIIGHNPSFFVTDELVREKASLTELLYDADIGLIARLQNSRQIVGYLVFGYKQNGSIFTDQDVGLIRTASDELAIAIQNGQRFKAIQDFNKTLQAKVNEATQELRTTNRKLRVLDEVKDEFMNMASHQLRTPLTAVKGYLSMVLDGDTGPVKPAQQRLLSEAYTSAQRMVFLVSDFLNVSRIHTGKFAIEPRPINLAALIQTEIEQLKVVAKSRGLTLLYQAPSQFPTLMLDEDKLRQVVMNFIDNAIYYTRAGGTVEVILMVTDREAVFKVTDTGIGVPEREQHQLFTKFFRASNALRMRPDGTGIGLFLAKKVVVMHGGSIIFESKVDQGSTFGFSLPLAKLLVDQ